MLTSYLNNSVEIEQPKSWTYKSRYSRLRYVFILSFLIFCLFDAHLEVLLHVDNFILAECYEMGMLAFLLLKITTTRKVKPLLLWSLLYLLLIFVIGTIKNNTFISLVGTFFLFKSIIAFQCGYILTPSKKEIYKIFNVILLIACVSGAVSILQYFIHTPFVNNPFGFPIVKNSIAERGKGIFSHPNRNGHVLLYGVIICFYFFTSPRQQWKRIICLLLLIGGMISSGSRQSLLGLVIIMIVHFFILNKASKKIIGFIGMSIFLILFISFFGEDLIQKRFSAIGNAVETGDYFRLKATVNSFEILRDYPAFGVGAGLWGGTVADKYGSPYYQQYGTFNGYLRKASMDIDTYWPHAWAELGIIGFLLYSILLVNILAKLFKYRKTVGDVSKMLTLMLLSTIFVSVFSLEIEAPFINLTAFMLAGSIINKHKFYEQELA